MKRNALVLITAITMTTGCTSWGNGQPLDAVPMPADPASRYEVWSKGEHWQLHALRIDGDTVRGVRWWHDRACDSCQVAIPRSAVDSVRTSGLDGGETGALTLFILPLVVIAYFIMAFSGDRPGS